MENKTLNQSMHDDANNLKKGDQERDKQYMIDKKHNWNAKVARYLAYAVDGGLLCSQFTLSQIIQMLGASSSIDPQDEAEINKQIAYLLHIRRVGQEY